MTTRSTWEVWVRDSSLVYTQESDIYTPNNENGLNLEEISTKVTQQLLNGDLAFVTPTTKYNKSQVELEWQQVDWDFFTRLRDYQRADDYLKLITNIGSIELRGSFIKVTPTILTGEDLNEEAVLKVTAIFLIQE